MLYGNVLIGVGAGAILTSLVSMKWFFVVPVATYQGKTVESGMLMPSLFSDPVGYLKIWSFYVFNLTESQAGISESTSDFGFFVGTDWNSYKWGGLPPSLSGQTAAQFQANYGSFGPYAGFAALGAIGLGVVLNVIL